ncbi:carbohydrate-binding family 9-like protein [Parapedobacter sp. 10938]|uniref:carbohydrate-binding family 9-like protein n=1 Tax=Parapedobacter flavus TaxID=3110225 RepID=UPI002DBBDE44|nr:carbohydrate-binding family 9-like protein [Parapedobacter sp. 10938]MEC3880985.1 carbohydrate-binding family 9-like protein [Parapedobacter sp. 10938]
MKTKTIPFLGGVTPHTTAEELLANMAPLGATELTEVPWKAFPYRPSVHFKMAHTAVGILLFFEVQEKHVKAVYRDTNDPVYKDSCVEFFFSLDGSNYYNLEFNCIGTGLIGYGSAQRNERKRLPRETIEQVKTTSSIATESLENGDTEWRLLLHIPLAVFEAHTIRSLAGMRCTGNFYKCGDDLPEPHYVAWNPIDNPTPNFHLPQYFGELVFQ